MVEHGKAAGECMRALSASFVSCNNDGACVGAGVKNKI
jgi:hypothetical protein